MCGDAGTSGRRKWWARLVMRDDGVSHCPHRLNDWLLSRFAGARECLVLSTSGYKRNGGLSTVSGWVGFSAKMRLATPCDKSAPPTGNRR